MLPSNLPSNLPTNACYLATYLATYQPTKQTTRTSPQKWILPLANLRRTRKAPSLGTSSFTGQKNHHM